MRAGSYVPQPGGYRAFVPAPLPPDPPIRMDMGLIRLLSEADQALARLDGVALKLPNPELFVAMYVRQEAVLSSQIEGTESTLEDVLAFEAVGRRREQPKDVEEVVNYVNAMNYGLSRVAELPLSLRLIREIHEKLVRGARGRHRMAGQFRTNQSFIGPPGCRITGATFVPPPVSEMHRALDDLESFLHSEDPYPALLHCGIAHAQFETIHPFMDGNGRVGRLLITFFLCERAVLHRPLLYLSHYLRAHRAQYYDRLMAIRNSGDWEGWLGFFLRGVKTVSSQATEIAGAIVDMREDHRRLISEHLAASSAAAAALDWLFWQPVTTVGLLAARLDCAYATANRLVDQFVRLGLLQETTGALRNRRFRYGPYLDLFAGQQPSEAEAGARATGEQH